MSFPQVLSDKNILIIYVFIYSFIQYIPTAVSPASNLHNSPFP